MLLYDMRRISIHRCPTYLFVSQQDQQPRYSVGLVGHDTICYYVSQELTLGVQSGSGKSTLALALLATSKSTKHLPAIVRSTNQYVFF